MNLGYAFYRDLYQAVDFMEPSKNNSEIKKRLERIILHSSSTLRSSHPLLTNRLAEHPDYKSFSLRTMYPGLLIGVGYDHGLPGVKEDVELGFSFDYTTGLPYIPGSSMKGLLRQAFGLGKDVFSSEKKEYIVDILCGINPTFKKITEGSKIEQEYWVDQLAENLFENPGPSSNWDIFLDAFPVSSKKKLLDFDSLTPHVNSDKVTRREGKIQYKPDVLAELDNPIPLRMLRVAPDVTFEFAFLLHDGVVDGITVASEHKLALFKQIILDFGLGAKTNVGYGQFQ